MNVASKNDLREEIADLKRKLELIINNDSIDNKESSVNKASYNLNGILEYEDIDKLVKDFKTGGTWGSRGFRAYIWANMVKSRARYNCQVCTSNKELQSHHLHGFKEHPDLRLELTNGVCLCKKCHEEYHDTNGYANNTKEDFSKFLTEKKGKIESKINDIRKAYSKLSKDEDALRLEEHGIDSFLETL